MFIYLEKILFYLLIFCLPFQTRKILYQWGSDFNEWASAYFYLTDLLILLIFLFWFWRKRNQRFLKELSFQWFRNKIKTPDFWLVTFLIISLISLMQARNIQLGFYHWFKLLELTGLFFYLKYNFQQLFNFKRLAQALVASGFLQSLIAFGQYINQGSLGLKFLAESPLSPEIAGVAKIVVEGTKIIRPYGTFPHPNLLAAFLFLAIFCFYYLWLTSDKKLRITTYGLRITLFLVLVTAFLLTFSRIIIATFLLASLIYFVFIFWQAKKAKDKKLFYKIFTLLLLITGYGLLITFLAWPEISARWSISLTEQAVSLRAFYQQTAFSIIKEHPWLGIGLGNFVWEIKKMLDLLVSWLHQPVHNIYLLIGSEVGLLGLSLFLIFLFLILKQFSQQQTMNSQQYYGLLFIVLSSLFIGLFDHFFWTLQQGQLMFWILLGILASGSLVKNQKMVPCQKV
jgi:O-antigen ligase